MRLLSSLLAPSLILSAQGPGLRAVRVQGPVKLDGRLGDPAWAQAPAATHGFTQLWPAYGAASKLQTEVRVLYDGAFLYVGAHLRVPEGAKGVVRRVHRRDQDSNSDWLAVYLDTLHDRRNAMVFMVNAGGVQRDGTCTNDSIGGYGVQADTSWDGVWESAVSLDDTGWHAELKIPLSLLRIRKGGGPQTWGINVQRSSQGSLREQAFLHVPPRSETSFIGAFPDLDGLVDLDPPPRREWTPYLSAKRKFETAQPYDDRRWEGRAGLDARLALSTRSQVDLTLRPDFGQVEVDQAVLNLSTQETFFPEKRPFFLEGAEIFQTIGPQLFYSRRIGTALSDPGLAPGETLKDRPLAQEIAAAAKYTAKYDRGLNVGLLAAGVEQAEAEVRLPSGETVHRELSPTTSYGVLRVQQMLGDAGTFLGGFISHMRQAGPTGREAVVAAMDGAVKSADRANLVEFALEHSRAGTPGDRPEGWYGRIRNMHTWAGGWTFDTRLINAGRWFNPNDLGFLQTPDNRHGEFFLQKRWDGAVGPTRNWNINLYGAVDKDQAGHTTNTEFSAQARTDFSNYWSVWGGGGLALPAEDDRELRTFSDPVKKYLRIERRPFANLGFDTAGNKPWYVRVGVARRWFEGGPSTETSVYQQIKLTPQLDIQLQTDLTREEGELRWLDTFGAAPGPRAGQSAGTPAVGHRRLGAFNQTIRVGYAFTPALSLQLFCQWLAANWAFRDLRSYLEDGRLAPGLPPGTPAPPTAFSYRTWNVNLIGRWEYRPGSTAFLVYTHGVSTDQLANDRAGISPRRDLTVLRHLPSDDVVQVKVSWLFR
ncbi:MAG: carbohydrate binding family 9 domain-containing protein [Acidobacteria bacterium]|nr:carbohydrate binding family 9 domain-containing protein [Acidobacteriota bacterium]